MIQPILTERTAPFLALYLQERDAPTLASAQSMAILRALATNSFHAPNEMDFDRRGRWKPISASAIEKYVTTRDELSIILRTTASPELSATFTTNPHFNTINVNFGPEHGVERRVPELATWTAHLATLLPRFWAANASCDSFEISDFYFANQLPYLPADCFAGGVLSWFHHLPKQTWSARFEREALERAPGCTVTFDEREAVTIVSYADPYAFTTQQVAERIAETSTYLASVARP